MYVDESGDSGLLPESQTNYFALSGIVIHELRWRETLDQLIDFRRRMKAIYGLPMRTEIHAGRMLGKMHGSELSAMSKTIRLSIIRNLADEMASMADLNVINVIVAKSGKVSSDHIFEIAWKALLQRFENTMGSGRFNGPRNADERGIVLPDYTDVKRLTTLLRAMRRHNPIPNMRSQYGLGSRNLRVQRLVEDPIFKKSDESYFTQMADLAAYLLYQKFAPSAYMRKTGGKNYFDRLDPILCKVASRTHPDGIVIL